MVCLSLFLLSSVVLVDGEPGPYPVGSWEGHPPMPVDQKGLTASSLNGKIYLFGGADMSGSTYIYDPGTRSWSRGADMPTPRYAAVSMALNGKIYVIGGGDYPPTRAYPLVEIYDPGTDSWSRGADMPTARFQAGIASLNGRIYVVGGSDRTTWMSTMEVYDPDTDTWSSAPPMPTARAGLSVVSLNGKIFALGGRDRQANTFSVVEVYDPGSGLWGVASDMLTPRRGGGAAAVSGRIYAFGGCGGLFSPPNDISLCGSYYGASEVYDPVNDSWSPIESVPTPRAYFATAPLPDRIFLIGGENANGTLSANEAFLVGGAAIDRVEVSPGTSIIKTGKSVTLTAQGYDARGDPIPGLTYTWHVTGGAGNISSTTGTSVVFTAAGAGTAEVHATASSGGSTRTGSANVTVYAAELRSVALTPSGLDLMPGSSGGMNASAYDQDGELIVSAMFAWDVQPSGVVALNTTSGANVSVTGLAAGTCMVTVHASYRGGSASASAQVNVSGGGQEPIGRVEVEPASATLHVGDTLRFTAVAYNRSGDPLPGAVITWSVESGGDIGDIDPTGLFKAIAPGTGRVVARAVLGGSARSGYADLTILEGPNTPPEVRITSPANGTLVTGLLTVRGTSSDDVGVVRVEVRVDSSPWRNASGTLSWTFALDTSTLAPGDHVVSARSFDGDLYSEEVTVVFTLGSGGSIPAGDPLLHIALVVFISFLLAVRRRSHPCSARRRSMS